MGHIAAGQVAAASLVVQHIGAGPGGDVDSLAGEGVIGALREKTGPTGDFPVRLGVGGAQGPVVLLDGDGAVGAQDGAGLVGEGGDGDAVVRRQLPHLVLQGDVLVGAEVVGVVHGAGVELVGTAGGEHGGVEGGEVGPGHQHCDHQHIPHGLAALKAHLAGGDDVFIAVSAPAPAVDHGVEQHHVEPHQGREVEDGGDGAGGVPVELPDEEGGHHVPQDAAGDEEQDAHPPVPGFYLPDGLGLPGLVDNVDDIGTADEPGGHEEQRRDDEHGEGQGVEVGLGVKGQGHLLRVHHDQAEDLPDDPGERCPQQGAGGAGGHRDNAQIPVELAAHLGAGGPQGQEDAGLPALAAEEQPRGVGGEHSAAHHRQDEYHHHLFAAVAALGEDGENRGGAHHGHIGGDEQHREETAAHEQQVVLPPLPAQVGGELIKGLHGRPLRSWI